MTPSNIIRTVAVALALGTTGLVAQAEGDIYSRLMEMREMDRNHDGMVSKEEFLAMIAKAWDMKAAEMKVRGGKMSAEQIKELEKVLGRTLSGS